MALLLAGDSCQVIYRRIRYKPSYDAPIAYDIFQDHPIGYVVVLILFSLIFAYQVTSVWMDDLPPGIYCYLVEASNGEKTYTLPAQVRVFSDEEMEEYTYYFTGDREVSQRLKKAMCIEKAYWPNGGYLYFEDIEPVTFGESARLYDQDGNGWRCRLTEQRSSHPKIEEEHERNLTGPIRYTIIHVLAVASFVVSVVLCIRQKEVNRQWCISKGFSPD